MGKRLVAGLNPPSAWHRATFSAVVAVFSLICMAVIITAYHMPPAGVQLHPAAAPPQQLSAWRVLLNEGQALHLNRDVLPYDLNTPLFTDYAQKLRTVWLPPGTSAVYSATDSFDFPVGTILSKTFYYPLAESVGSAAAGAEPGARRRVLKQAPGLPGFNGTALDLRRVRLIETRLLVHQQSGWQALPYVWNAEQSDAFLALGGDWVNLELVNTTATDTNLDMGTELDVNHQPTAFDYLVPDANQCAGCHATDHSRGEPRPIGPKARHLNRDFDYTHGRANQLQYWQHSGRLSSLPSAAEPPRTALWQDSANDSLEQRARGYLDINCGHCHNPSGAADTSGLLLDNASRAPRQLGVCKPPVAAGRGSGGHAYAIQPGRPQASILTFRMASTDPAQMMPELGRSLVHWEGVALISRWIESLDGTCPAAGRR